MLTGRRVVLGVSGGIAAYKAVEVCRRLVDAGAHVVPVMTKGAEHFLGRATLSALASEPVQTALFDGPVPIPHTKLGQSADLIVVAPATARVISAYAHGLSTDLLTNTLLASRAPVVVCPAMHSEMWEHPAVVDNIEILRRRGVHIVEPETGRLAGGDVGTGRLASPADIVAAAERVLGPHDLGGRPGRRECRGYPRTDRRGPRDRQPQFRQAGLRHRRRSGGARCVGDTGFDGRPPDAGRCRGRARRDGRRDASRRRTSRRGRRCRRDGRRRRRLPTRRLPPTAS